MTRNEYDFLVEFLEQWMFVHDEWGEVQESLWNALRGKEFLEDEFIEQLVRALLNGYQTTEEHFKENYSDQTKEAIHYCLEILSTYHPLDIENAVKLIPAWMMEKQEAEAPPPTVESLQRMLKEVQEERDNLAFRLASLEH